MLSTWALRVSEMRRSWKLHEIERWRVGAICASELQDSRPDRGDVHLGTIQKARRKERKMGRGRKGKEEGEMAADILNQVEIGFGNTLPSRLSESREWISLRLNERMKE
jgi:hypothetical protein